MSEELKPCPWCSTTPVLRPYMGMDDRPDLAMWWHPETGCYMDGEIVAAFTGDAKEIEKWNTRPPAVPVEALQNYARIARLFHESYENLAPAFNYKTREASAVAWDEVPESNKRLVTATVALVMDTLIDQARGGGDD